MLLIIIWFMALTLISTIFQIYSGSRFDWLWKPDHTGETIDLLEVIDELYHIMLCRTRSFSGECIGSCKSYYIAFTTTIVPH